MKIIGWRFKWLDDNSDNVSFLALRLSKYWILHLGTKRCLWHFGHSHGYDFWTEEWYLGPIRLIKLYYDMATGGKCE